jgi:hypothetical protein
MASVKPRALVDIEYEESAQAYPRGLPLEHFMESVAQAQQHKRDRRWNRNWRSCGPGSA